MAERALGSRTVGKAGPVSDSRPRSGFKLQICCVTPGELLSLSELLPFFSASLMIEVSAWHIADLANSPVACPTPMEENYPEFSRSGWSDMERAVLYPHPLLQWKKELVLAAAITLAVSPHPSGSQFPQLSMGALTVWILWGSRRQCVRKG